MQSVTPKIVRMLLIIAVIAALPVSITQAKFPEKSITVIVHTNPGGAMDLMARQIAQVAAKYCEQPLVVVNKPGGSGLLAMSHVFNNKSDGYNLLAFPAAFLAPIQTQNIGFDLDDFEYIACLTISPEAVFVNPESDLNDFGKILQSAKENPGVQKWCGPGSGSLDNLMAIKIWDAAGIKAQWIPYAGGSSAIVSVMGQHNDVYIGNPEDIIGRNENMSIAAISLENRHPLFPDSPTFAEFGLDLSAEVMWRGFVLKRGTDPEILAFYENLLRQCSQDTAWLEFVKKTMVQPVFMESDQFKKLVDKDAASSIKYLKMAGFSLGKVAENPPLVLPVFLITWLLFLVVGGLKYSGRGSNAVTDFILPAFLVALGITALYMSFYFPAPLQGAIVGAASLPRTWSIVLIILSLLLMFNPVKRIYESIDGIHPSAILILSSIICYSILIYVIGFFPSTALMLLTGMIILGCRNTKSILVSTALVLFFLYLTFQELLGVPLPTGAIF